MIRDWWISIELVCFMFQGLLLCDHPGLGNNQLVKFASQIFLIFLSGFARNFFPRVTRKSHFHTNHMLGTLDFTVFEHWAPFNFP